MDLFVGDVSAFGRVKIFFRSGKLRDGCMWRRAEKELRAGGKRGERWGGLGRASGCQWVPVGAPGRHPEASRGLQRPRDFPGLFPGLLDLVV